jgi:hypothetical protein
MPRRFTGRRIAQTLLPLLESPVVKVRAAELARRCAAQDAIGETATLVESAVTGASPRPSIAGGVNSPA